MTIFILGAGVMQLPAIRTASELGWRVVVADGNASALGAPLADRFLHVDLKDKDALVAAARDLRAESGLDGVFTAGTDFSASVAWVAERLGLPGIPYEVALKASDKLRMRRAFDVAGVPSPRFEALTAEVLEAGVALESLAARLGFPLVVKPADNMGARGCRAARDPDELREAARAALPYSRSGRVIVEEFIDGPEFSVDALVVDGEIKIRGFADRHISFSPYFVELGHTMPSAFPREVREEALRVFEAGVRAIGIGLGAAKGDIKYCTSRGGAFVGEIAARLSGGFMSGWTYPYASGVDVTREALELAVGLRGRAASKDRAWVSVERGLVSIPGRVVSVLGALEAERLPYVKNLFLRAGPGDRTVFPANNVEKYGNAISQAPDRALATAAAESAVRALLLRLEAEDGATEAFLAGEEVIENPDGSLWPPLAFTPDPASAAEIATMPDYLGRGDPAQVIGIAPWPGAAEVPGRDWTSRTFVEAAELAMRLGGAAVDGVEGSILAGRFWRAILRGGAQAGLYVIDTARKARSRG
jgi:biotin carboxylase